MEKIDSKNIENILSLPPMQEGMLFHYLKDSRSSLYFEQLSLEISGSIDAKLFEKAWNLVIQANEMLRTVFRWEKLEKPSQIILKEHTCEIRFHDFSGMDGDQKKTALAKIKTNDGTEGFDLTLVPFRVTLCKLAETQYEMIISNHHILYDGWSNGILLKEFFRAYHELSHGRQAMKLPTKTPFKEFIKWIQSRDRNKQEQFWRNYLAGFETAAELPIKRKKEEITGADNYSIILEEDIKDQLEVFVKNNRVTLASFFYSAWGILLQKYYGCEDVVFGTTVSGRSGGIKGIEDMVGLFINTIPLRINTYPGETIVNVVSQTDQLLREREEFEHTSLVDIGCRDVARNVSTLTGGELLFDTILVIENYPLDNHLVPEGSLLSIHSYSMVETTHYDLTVGIMPFKGIEVKFSFKQELFENDAIENLAVHFKTIIQKIIEQPETALSQIEIISSKEKNRILYEFNNTVAAYPADKSIHQIFKEQMKKVPNQRAVISYLVLNPIYNELESSKDEIEGKLMDEFEKCCFKENPYMFRFEDSAFITALNFFDREELEHLNLIRTHKGNYAAVNNEIILLLKYFDGETNLKSLFTGLVNKKLEFMVFPIIIDEEKGRIYHEKKKFKINEAFDELVALVKTLYQINLIEMTDYRSTLISIDIAFNDDIIKSILATKETAERKTKTKNLLNYMENSSENKCGHKVLLLGDKNGAASTGLLYIASFLRRHGIKSYCRWNDFNKTTESLRQDVVKLLSTIQPTIVGLSMKWFPHIARVLEIAKIVKNYDPSIIVVMGGNTASYYKEKIIQYDWVDYVIAGDGEVPLLKLCLEEEYIPNCVYKIGGKVVVNPIDYVHDENNSKDIYLSHLEAIFSSPLDKFLAPYFYINTGKGCSQQCVYCAGCRDTQAKTFNRKKPFLRGIEEVRKDIIETQKYTAAFMYDFDLPLYDSLNYYTNIWKGTDLTGHFCIFYFWMLPEPGFIELVVKTFKYIYINIDICSLSEKHRLKLSDLKIVKPQPTDEEFFQFFDRCSKYDNLEITINQITGLPYFSFEDIDASKETLSKIIAKYSCFSGMDWGRLHAQPGAPIIENCEKYDMHSYAKNFEDFLYYSELNLKEDLYPEILKFNYPYIYFNDQELNSKLTQYYIDTTLRIEKSIHEKRRNLELYRELTYGELDEKASILARKLKEKGVTSGTIVGLFIDRSLEMIIGLLAILKVGAAYLPMDSRYPADRIKYMIKDSNISIILTEKNKLAGLPLNLEKIDITDENLYITRNGNPTPLIKNTIADNLAYVLYTSGSTGKPKGVMVEHKNVLSLIKNTNYIEWLEGDKLLLTGSITFDITTFEIWGTLLNQLTLFLADQEIILDGKKLETFLHKNNISILHLIPQLFNQMSEMYPGIYKKIKYLLVGGDLVSPHYINKIRNLYPSLKILHMYGPTENTTFSTFFPVEKDYKYNIPIGLPISNSTAYIFDKYGQLQLMGLTGELCVGGEGVARGYLNNPELTWEKFGPLIMQITQIKDKSFSGGERLFKKALIYHTGDLARRLPDGNIEFLGRIDHQVKIRGFRIEVEEIQSQLMKYPGIKEAVVLAQEERGDKFLCAYIISTRELVTAELWEYLAQELPDYMIPSYFVFLKQIPLTPNGKIDRKALPKPGLTVCESYAVPRNEIETKLVQIWSEALGRDELHASQLQSSIGIDDNFFQLGGHSLKATLLVSKINKVFDVKIPLANIFKTPTIRKLSEFIGHADAEKHTAIAPVEKKEYYILSSAQKRLFFLQQIDKAGIAYNISAAWILEGVLDKNHLKTVFTRLIQRHESLRTSFIIVDKQPVQKIHDHLDFEISYDDTFCRTKDIEPEQFHCNSPTQSDRIKKIMQNFVRPFDLEMAPLLRVGLIKTGENEHILTLDIHHIILDGSSQRIFVQDFKGLYLRSEIPPLRLQYRDFSQWQNELLKTPDITKQEQYWLKEFSDEIPVLKLPTDYIRPISQCFIGDSMNFEIGTQETQALKELALREGATIFMILLAIYYILLSKLSGQEDIVIGTPVAGRRHIDLQEIIGMFVNTLVLRINSPRASTFEAFFKVVKKKILDAFENQDYQFEELVEKVAIERDMSRNPIFDVMFILQNVDKETINIPGMKLNPFWYENMIAKFDVYFTAYEIGEKLSFLVQYNSSLFKAETIERFIFSFKNIATTVIEQPSMTLSEIMRFPEEQNIEILNQFNTLDLENE